MRDHLVSHRSQNAGRRAPTERRREARRLGILVAAMAAVAVAMAPAPVRAASVLSDGSVTPTTGTTATTFTFSVHYTSTDPVRPAQAVWAQAGSVTVTLAKVSGSAHDGTWQGTSTLPAGSWQVTFHATTSSDPQPAPLVGPIVTVTPAPTPQPTPTPRPTPAPTPRPPTPPPPPPPVGPTPPPALQPTPSPTDDDSTARPSPSPTPEESGSVRPSPTTTPEVTPTDGKNDPPTASPEPPEAAAVEGDQPPASVFGPLLMIGGTMSIVGAAVLARQWYLTRRA